MRPSRQTWRRGPPRRGVAGLRGAVGARGAAPGRVSRGGVAAGGDGGAVRALERVAGTATGEHLVRAARLAALRLRQRRTPTDEARQLRTDLEALREENRKLRDQVTGIEARLENAK